LYEKPNMSGSWMFIPGGGEWKGGSEDWWNDKTSSVTTTVPRCVLTVFEHSDFKGDQDTHVGFVNIGSRWRNAISSARCGCSAN
jgi:hypothetical protein